MKAPLAHKHFLIVDDEPDIGEILQFQLEGLGVSSRYASTVDEAMRLFTKERFDGVLSDVRMPGKGGIELLKWVRGHSTSIPFIFMTGHSDIGLPKANHLGAEAMVMKPFDVEELERVLSHFIAPIPERWEVKELAASVEIVSDYVTRGHGGAFVDYRGTPGVRPRVGEHVNVRCAGHPGVYEVVCRWQDGLGWGGEIVAWDEAAKNLGWESGQVVSFIPLKQS